MTPYCYDSYASVVMFDICWMLIGASLAVIGFAIAKWVNGRCKPLDAALPTPEPAPELQKEKR